MLYWDVLGEIFSFVCLDRIIDNCQPLFFSVFFNGEKELEEVERKRLQDLIGRGKLPTLKCLLNNRFLLAAGGPPNPKELQRGIIFHRES